MAKNKIQRIDQEIAKVREKIAEYQDKLKTLEAQKTEAENLEIVQMVRALRLTPEQLNAMGMWCLETEYEVKSGRMMDAGSLETVMLRILALRKETRRG